jgi:hypothetical protein
MYLDIFLLKNIVIWFDFIAKSKKTIWIKPANMTPQDKNSRKSLEK